VDQDKIKEGVRLILEGIGEDPDRPGLVETPRRVAEMYADIFSGIDSVDPSSLLVEMAGDHHREMSASIICCRSTAVPMWRTSRVSTAASPA